MGFYMSLNDGVHANVFQSFEADLEKRSAAFRYRLQLVVKLLVALAF